jgi:hypothetical protein
VNKPTLLLCTLSLGALLSGCVGTGPNTQRGAVAGGTLGAIAGGVLANNSHHGDPVGGAILGATAGALAGGAIGNSIDQQQGTIYGMPQGNPDHRGYPVPVTQAPPAPTSPPPTPTDPVPPQPAANAVWIPGFWIYDGHSYTWMRGRWEIPPPLARAYVPAHSEARNGQMVYVPGYWQM